MWGSDPSIQNHYKQGRSIHEIQRNQIDGYCACGYLTLKPSDDSENYRGGLTVKRKQVDIFDENGNEVKVLRSRTIKGEKEFNTYCNCNACVNNWK
jgi:hypothetical protein